MTLWALKFSILQKNSQDEGSSTANYKFLDAQFSKKKKIYDNFPTAQNLGGGQLRPAQLPSNYSAIIVTDE